MNPEPSNDRALKNMLIPASAETSSLDKSKSASAMATDTTPQPQKLATRLWSSIKHVSQDVGAIATSSVQNFTMASSDGMAGRT